MWWLVVSHTLAKSQKTPTINSPFSRALVSLSINVRSAILKKQSFQNLNWSPYRISYWLGKCRNISYTTFSKTFDGARNMDKDSDS